LTQRPGRLGRRAGWIAGAIVAAGLWRRWRPFRVGVEGSSMIPTVREGDLLVAIRTTPPRRGDLVVAEHPARPGFELVKRFVAGPGDDVPGHGTLGPGEVWLAGDASDASTDSRTFGPVRHAAVRGVIVYRYWPPKRAGRIERGPTAP
jgi:signal peptidase I